MLIKCPECNREVSDTAEVCVHCGFPLKSGTGKGICTINNNKQYDFSVIIDKIRENVPVGLVIRAIRDICDMTPADAKKLYDIIKDTNEIPNYFDCQLLNGYNIPHCPTCQSTNIKKIGGANKIISIKVFGVYSSKINKTFKCKNCGYTW